MNVKLKTVGLTNPPLSFVKEDEINSTQTELDLYHHNVPKLAQENLEKASALYPDEFWYLCQ
jgi:hypothetical protein